MMLFVAALYEPAGKPDADLLKNDQPVSERDPARAVLYQGRGIQFVKDGKLELALDQFHRAAAYDPLNISVVINIAYVLDKLGRYQEAIDELQAAEKIDSHNTMVYLNWGNSLINMKKYEEALEPLQKAVDLDPSNHLAYVNLGAALNNLGRYREAAAKFEKAIELDPKNDALILHLATIWTNLGELDKAILLYGRLIELDPKNLSAYYNCAALYEKQGKLDAAIEEMRAAIKDRPRQHDASRCAVASARRPSQSESGGQHALHVSRAGISALTSESSWKYAHELATMPRPREWRCHNVAYAMHGRALKILAAIVVVLAVAFPFLLALEKISESDTFWHLKAGEWIVSHGADPHADPFSATVNGKQWLDWEWLFQVGIYVLYAWGGFDAMVVGKAIIVCLAGLVVFRACRRNGAGVSLSAFAMMAAFVASRARLEVRPDVVMLLFAALTIALLEAARRGKPYALLWLPVLELVWVNVHGSFLLGIALMAMYGLVHGIEFALKKEWRCLGLIVGAFALSCAACLVNPFGIRLAQHAIEQTRSSSPAGTIGEWLPTRELLLTEPNWALQVFWWLFWLNPAVLVAVLAIQRRAFPWAHALVVAAMSVLALHANRFTALYAVVTAPILAHGLAVLRERFAGKKHSDWGQATAGTVAAVTAAFLIFVVVTNRWAIAEARPTLAWAWTNRSCRRGRCQ